MAGWEAVANIDLVYQGHNTQFQHHSADIVFTALDSRIMGGALGLGVFPSKAFGNDFLSALGLNRRVYSQPEGDIFVNADYTQVWKHNGPGTFTQYVALHEVGHALGLKHTHDGGLVGNPTYQELGWGEFDSAYHTVMSYNPIPTASLPAGNSSTPMPEDILAIQYLYGANKSYATGNNTYQMFNISEVKTIWDAGGNDTFDASSWSSPVELDLREGAYSFAGTDFYAATRIAAVAYYSVIENAVGGSGADNLIGNEYANLIIGNGGGDTVHGGGAADHIVGATGVDHLFGDAGNDLILGNQEADLLDGGDGDDTLFGGQNSGAARLDAYGTMRQQDGVESLYGRAGNDLIYGNYGNESISGGEGNDTLFGGQNEDTLSGGPGNDEIWGNRDNDLLIGGAGADTFKFGSANQGTDFILDFKPTEGDQISISGVYTVSDGDGFMLITYSGGLIGVYGVDALSFSSSWMV
jgi:serralysin